MMKYLSVMAICVAMCCVSSCATQQYVSPEKKEHLCNSSISLELCHDKLFNYGNELVHLNTMKNPNATAKELVKYFDDVVFIYQESIILIEKILTESQDGNFAHKELAEKMFVYVKGGLIMTSSDDMLDRFIQLIQHKDVFSVPESRKIVREVKQMKREFKSLQQKAIDFGLDVDID